MSAGEEVEIKFLLAHPERIPERIEAHGGQRVNPRTHEFNLRFDNASGDFRRSNRVLRLRKDNRSRLTYKDDSKWTGATVRRREVEVEVASFEEARTLVECLGFAVVFAYEKYRTTYRLGNSEVVLDELPIGQFLEIEGEEAGLPQCAALLELDWTAGIPLSYHALFDQLVRRRHLPLNNLTFEELGTTQITADDLGVRPADVTSST
jgi:adenylate cyclase class 2